MNGIISRPAFAGAYTKVRDQWHEISGDVHRPAMPDEVVTEYNDAREKQALYLNSRNALDDFGFALMPTTIANHPLVLTGKEITDFNNAHAAGKRQLLGLLNRWFYGFYQFRQIETEQLESLDLII